MGYILGAKVKFLAVEYYALFTVMLRLYYIYFYFYYGCQNAQTTHTLLRC